MRTHVLSLPTVPSWSFDIPTIGLTENGTQILVGLFVLFGVLLTVAGQITIGVIANKGKKAAQDAEFNSKPNNGKSGHDQLKADIADVRAEVAIIVGILVSMIPFAELSPGQWEHIRDLVDKHLNSTRHEEPYEGS